jgi:arylsulfatase A-like enzyme
LGDALITAWCLGDLGDIWSYGAVERVRWIGTGLTVLLVGVLGFLLIRPGEAAPRPAARPNLLLLVLDDARTGSTSVMTKTEAWLRRGGAYFPNTVATTPSCCPSRASILSGRYSHNHRVTLQGAIDRYDHNRTVQHDLKAAGYGTAAIGKLFNEWRLAERPPGFDRWALTHGGYDNARFVVDGRRVTAPYSTTFIGEQVNRYVDGFESDDARPWFVYAGFTAPHSPYTPESRYAQREFPWKGNPATRETDRGDKPAWVRHYKVTKDEGTATRTGQLRTLLSVDDAVESVRRHLDARGELDNTLVMLVSDNGKAWGEHGLPGKFTPYAESVGVMTYLWWPGRAPKGEDRRLAALVDVAPTLLAAAGLTPSYQVDGRDLLGPQRRDRVLLEYWKDPANGNYPSWASTYAAGKWQYTEYYDERGRRFDREYYDLAADPWQLSNVLRDGDTRNDPNLTALADALATQRRCTAAACP